MCCIECVRSGSKQNARGKMEMAFDLQKLPCSGQKLGFLCFRVFESLENRVLGLLQSAEFV